MTSFAEHVANLESDLRTTTRISELRQLVATLRTSVAVTPVENADDSWARLLELDSFIETGSQVVSTCHQLTVGFKSLSGSSPNKQLVVERLLTLYGELRVQMDQVERMCVNGFQDWAALALWRKLAQKAEEGIASILAPTVAAIGQQK